MQDITSKEEQQARRQFSRLFCGEVMHLCSKEVAINEDSWDEVILDDIIHNAYPGNHLTTEKIKVLITMLGWPADALYFSKPTDKAIIEWIFPFVAEYISMATYIQFKQSEIPDPAQSVIKFYKKFCTHNSNPGIRITTGNLYDLYLTWCYNTSRISMTPKTFHSTFVRLGAVRNKGYCEGKSGVTYYLLKLNPEEVLNDGEPEIPEAKTQQTSTDSTKSLRDVDRSREEVPKGSVSGTEKKVSGGQKGSRQDDTTSDGGNDSRNESDGASSEKVSIVAADNNTEDQLSTPGNLSSAESGETRTTEAPDIRPTKTRAVQYPNDPTNVIGRLKQLPIGFRPVFDEIRICCKLAMDPFTQEQFVGMASDAGFYFTEEQTQELYEFLLEYAKVDLRELKKGAIQ